MADWMILVLLFSLGLFTGFIGTSTGGSVMVTVPMMTSLGISPTSAVANARLASIGTMVGGLRQFHKIGKIDYQTAFTASILGIIGAFFGAHLLVNIPENILSKLFASLMLILVFISFFPRRLLSKNNALSKKKMCLGYASFLLIGVLGGIFGGQAMLATYIFRFFFNKSISESIGTRKMSGLAISLTSMIIYGLHGIINWKFSTFLITGTLLGSSFGSKYAFKKGDAWIQNLFTCVVCILAIKMLFWGT